MAIQVFIFWIASHPRVASLLVSLEFTFFLAMTSIIFPIDHYPMDRGEQCDDGLTRAYISLKESCHRMRLFHVLEYLEEDNLLLVREREGKSCDE